MKENIHIVPTGDHVVNIRKMYDDKHILVLNY